MADEIEVGSPPVGMTLLKSNKSVNERAESYFDSIRRNLERGVLDPLVDKRAKLEQRLFDLKDFNLDTNLNAGLTRMTAEECEARFREIISIEYELTLLEIELKVKHASFKKYFG